MPLSGGEFFAAPVTLRPGQASGRVVLLSGCPGRGNRGGTGLGLRDILRGEVCGGGGVSEVAVRLSLPVTFSDVRDEIRCHLAASFNRLIGLQSG